MNGRRAYDRAVAWRWFSAPAPCLPGAVKLVAGAASRNESPRKEYGTNGERTGHLPRTIGVRFAFDEFIVDTARACLLRHGEEVRLRPKSYEAFKYLIENRGRLVTKDELIRVLWPDSFVTDDSLVKCLRDVRLALGDEERRYIKTVPRRGYIFDAEVIDAAHEDTRARSERASESSPLPTGHHRQLSGSAGWLLGAASVIILLAGAAYVGSSLVPKAGAVPEPQKQLVRLTFDPGLQSEPTWSPDARFVAYTSDRTGNHDVWVKPVDGGGDAIRLTSSPAHDSQADWSPDGSRIAFRSEREGGGLYVIPALGGPEQRISTFGFRPRWSRDGSQLLFTTSLLHNVVVAPRLFVATLDGRPPREVFADIVDGFKSVRAAWHPDGRISLWGVHRREGDSFWTVPLSGERPRRSHVGAAVAEQLRGAGSPQLLEFFWAPAGDAIFFEGLSRGVRNLWRVRVDPANLEWLTGPERLTVGPGSDLNAAVSRDGKRLAFTARRESARFWLFAFDAAAGRVARAGRPFTSDQLTSLEGELSPDGRVLVHAADRAGQRELWETSVETGSEKLLARDSSWRGFPRWSRDGRRLLYVRTHAGRGDTEPPQHSLVVLPAGGGEEQVVTTPDSALVLPSDWSPDGAWVLASSNRGTDGRHQICRFPLSASPRAETGMRVIASDPGKDLWHARISEDGHWVSFHAVAAKERNVSTIYVRRLDGERWIAIAPSGGWDGKARWAPDGKALYFISNRTGLFEMWGIRFDPVQETSVGQPFRIAEDPRVDRGMTLAGNPPPGLSLAAGRLAIPLSDASSSLWMLENVAR
jgi:Tol biopolymer transport system component/DNA-binding winged helix-turn-helix (wHTH) protein